MSPESSHVPETNMTQTFEPCLFSRVNLGWFLSCGAEKHPKQRNRCPILWRRWNFLSYCTDISFLRNQRGGNQWHVQQVEVLQVLQKVHCKIKVTLTSLKPGETKAPIFLSSKHSPNIKTFMLPDTKTFWGPFLPPCPLMVSVPVSLPGEFYNSPQRRASCYSLIQGTVSGRALQIHWSHPSRNLRIKDTSLKMSMQCCAQMSRLLLWQLNEDKCQRHLHIALTWQDEPPSYPQCTL